MLVVPQVFLVAHQDDGNVGAEVFHLRRPLLRDIFCPRKEVGVEGERGRGRGRDDERTSEPRRLGEAEAGVEGSELFT